MIRCPDESSPLLANTPSNVNTLNVSFSAEAYSLDGRTVDVSNNTIPKLLKSAGMVCAAFQDAKLHILSCKRVEVDETWSFVFVKNKNVDSARRAPKEADDAWTWTAIDP